MKIIEHRRHSIRDKIHNGIHLIQPSVDLSRKVGSTMDQFDYIITSPKERAYETAIAMGYAGNEIVEVLGSYNDDIAKEFTFETLTFPQIAELLNQKTFTYQFAQQQANLLLKLSSKIKDGKKLLILSHGGVIDIPLVFLFPYEDHSSWGSLVSYCEGYRIQIEGDKFNNFEILRTHELC